MVGSDRARGSAVVERGEGSGEMSDSMLVPASASAEALDAPLLPAGSATRPRVTVIDDSPEFLSLMRDVLGEAHEVRTLETVRSIAEVAASEPDLLLIDLHAGGPAGGLTGWEILALARSHPLLRDVPAVVCSADLATLREDRIRLVAFGDVQLIAKPFDLTAFEQVIDRMLRLSGSSQRSQVEDAEYPPLLDGGPSYFREGRPLRMCPHGRVLEQGDYCRICG
jgi:CheY-like chemotaxis protein